MKNNSSNKKTQMNNEQIQKIMESACIENTYISTQEINGSYNCHFKDADGKTVVGRFVPDFVEVKE